MHDESSLRIWTPGVSNWRRCGLGFLDLHPARANLVSGQTASRECYQKIALMFSYTLFFTA